MKVIKITSRYRGFTLAETLVSLLILSIISIYTIPKIFVTQQGSQFKAVAKEMASSVAATCSNMKAQGLINKNSGASATAMWDILPYLSYVSPKTSGLIDDTQTYGSVDCSLDNCYKLHNGAVLAYYASGYSNFWGGPNNTTALGFLVDPDGKYSGSTTGSGKSIYFVLYYNCRLSTWGSMTNGTVVNGVPTAPDPTQDPPWFSWN